MKKRRNIKKIKLSLVQKIIVSVIALLFLLIIFLIIFSIINSSENITKRKISELASDYYENYLYEQITDSNTESPAKTLEEYKSIGLSIVYLRQLLYHNDKTDAETINYLTEHCDENDTLVKFYPESPYKRNSYRVEYTYSCDF